jgi:hypothetical protein
VYQSWSAGGGPAPPRPIDRPVWVDLEAFYGPDKGSIEDPPPGWLLKATGRVPGVLRWWKRSLDGRWFGCRPGLELTADRSARRPFRQGRTARTPDAAA